MATQSFKINGTVDTSDTVMNNVNKLATAAGAFVTWDPIEGGWSAIPNSTGTSVFSFNDSNIVGAINIQGSSIDQLYNSVTIDFPNRELNDTRDFIDISIPAQDRYPQELDNRLVISSDLINNQAQAQYIATRELKQSRVDKIIDFRTTFVGNGLAAGDLIDVTSSVYDYTNKVFRIITIEETDDTGGIIFNITALEYDADVYDSSGLVVKQRSKSTEITPKEINEPAQAIDNEASAGNIAASLATTAGVAALTKLIGLSGSTGDPNELTEANIPLFQTAAYGFSTANISSTFGGGSTGTGQSTFEFGLVQQARNLILQYEGPQGNVTYTVDGTQKSIVAGVPVRVSLEREVGGSWDEIAVRFMEWSSYVTIINVANAPPGSYRFVTAPLNTYDLNASINFVVIDSVSNIILNPQGDAATLTVTGFLA
jgi:hypothetical protein